MDESGTERVIQYISHSLSSTQRRWETIEQEAYVVVYAITKLRPYLYGSKFTVYTDHKPLTSLFTKDMQNTKIQRWGVLLAEYGAKIEYRKGKNNIRADMLSRIPPQGTIATIDCDDWVDATAVPEKNIAEALPFFHDGLDLGAIAEAQKKDFSEILNTIDQNTEDYANLKGVVYSVRLPTLLSSNYPRLSLATAYRKQVINRTHVEVGHMATGKTLDRVRVAYVWPNMRKDIGSEVKGCALCQVHQRRPDYVPMGEMPLTNYPMQIVGADLIGPFVNSTKDNRYALTIIDHCTLWAEAYPLKDKRNESVWQAWATSFVPRHGIPEVLITDNGQEFKARYWVQ